MVHGWLGIHLWSGWSNYENDKDNDNENDDDNDNHKNDNDKDIEKSTYGPAGALWCEGWACRPTQAGSSTAFFYRILIIKYELNSFKAC